MGIPDNLVKLRERERLSQTGLAKKAGVSQQLISQLERGENLTTKRLPQIARALNAGIEEVDPNYAADDAMRSDLLRLFDRLPADLRSVALGRVEALVPTTPPPPAEAPRPKAARARR